MFVTFRTADSLPNEVILRWERELEEWLAVRNLPTMLAASLVQRRLGNQDEIINKLNASEQREIKRRRIASFTVRWTNVTALAF